MILSWGGFDSTKKCGNTAVWLIYILLFTEVPCKDCGLVIYNILLIYPWLSIIVKTTPI